MATNDLVAATAAISTATTTTLVAAVAGMRIKCFRVTLNVAAAQQLTFKSSGGTQLREPLNFTAAAFLTYDISPQGRVPWFTTLPGEGLQVVSTTTGATNITVETTTAP